MLVTAAKPARPVTGSEVNGGRYSAPYTPEYSCEEDRVPADIRDPGELVPGPDFLRGGNPGRVLAWPGAAQISWSVWTTGNAERERKSQSPWRSWRTTGSVAWMGDEIPVELRPPTLPRVDEAREKFLSEGRVEGGRRGTSWVMGEGLQSELVRGERVEGEREEGPEVVFSVVKGRSFRRGFERLLLLLLLLRD